jgi:hypothetical protein
MLTTRCANAFPNEKEFPDRFPIATILPHIKDLYEQLLETPSEDERKAWQDWRKNSSKPLEQTAVLVAMAQYQAKVLDTNRFDKNDPKLDAFEVQCLFKLP